MKINRFPKAPFDQTKNLPSLLERIRKRPVMWLGSTTASGLQNLLDGIHLAERIHNIPEKQCLRGFAFYDFEAWIEEKYNPKRLSCNSFSLASLTTTSEEEAFRKWFDWYDEFRAEVKQSGA